jgi:fermentation-respiration switch protein FrsA (DUF1100 family)
MQRVRFQSEGETLSGHLFLPESSKKNTKLPLVLIVGAWLTVKEQMPDLYARQLAEKGFATFTFDFRGFGESGGQPRQYESPSRKIKDIENALTYIESLPMIDKNRISGLGICFGAGYIISAASEDARLKSIATVVGWLHNREFTPLAFGGKEGVGRKVEASRNARGHYEQTGKLLTVPAASATDSSAAMFNVDYYLSAERGAIKEWKNEYALLSWEEYLNFDPIDKASKITIPTLLIHSKKAGLPQATEQFYNTLSSTQKQLLWMEGEHTDFYDQQSQVSAALDAISGYFHDKL